MKNAIILLLNFSILAFLISCTPDKKVNPEPIALMAKIKATNGLIALWDFKENEGQTRKSIVTDSFPLKEINGPLPRVEEGPLSGYSAKFGNKAFLSLPNSKTGLLNINGVGKGITVISWIKWAGGTGFLGGMWNEFEEKRQYGLFVSLPYYNGENQVCGHLSQTGKPTPPFPYSIDYSASAQKVKKNVWQCVAFTYDGKYIKSFLNDTFIARSPELISHTIGFEGYPEGLVQSKNPYYYPNGIGNNGSDFTVGAVLIKGGMGNFFNGLMGGLAIFNRALSEDELAKLTTN